MVTNVTVNPVEHVVVVYLQDGTTMTVEPQTTKSFQLIDNGFCTISETIDAESGEHPPEDQIPDFAKKMLAWWKNFYDALKNRPKATPTKK